MCAGIREGRRYAMYAHYGYTWGNREKLISFIIAVGGVRSTTTQPVHVYIYMGRRSSNCIYNGARSNQVSVEHDFLSSGMLHESFG